MLDGLCSSLPVLILTHSVALGPVPPAAARKAQLLASLGEALGRIQAAWQRGTCRHTVPSARLGGH